MTLDDFRAWLSGYSEGFVGGVPTREQWERVLDRLGAVKGERELARGQNAQDIPTNAVASHRLVPPEWYEKLKWVEVPEPRLDDFAGIISGRYGPPGS